jgi:hypothetical protein
MARRKAVGPGTGGDRFEALNDPRSSGKRGLAFNPNDRQAALPDTLRAHAFIKALMRWAARRPEPSTEIRIPTGIAAANDSFASSGRSAKRAIIIKIFEDGRMAELILEPTAKPITAEELVHALTKNGITAVKITRTTQAVKESPLSAACDPTGERAK